MPTPTQYNFTQEVDYPLVLQANIQSSSIATAFDHIDTLGTGSSMQVSVWFKDVLSSTDQTTLSSVMTAYTNVAPPVAIPVVTTQFELNNKDLKLAKMLASLPGDGSTTSATASVKIPGTPGSSDGRYIAGGYAISADYDADDWCDVWVEDKDRMIAWQMALASNPSATAPVADSVVQANGYPTYPVVKSYVDTELSVANQGWYFWPLANNGQATASGECEVEPLGGYGFIPAGLYICCSYNRLTKTSGSCRINLEWGKLE